MIPEETQEDVVNLKLSELKSKQPYCFGCEIKFEENFKTEPYISLCTQCKNHFCLYNQILYLSLTLRILGNAIYSFTTVFIIAPDAYS